MVHEVPSQPQTWFEEELAVWARQKVADVQLTTPNWVVVPMARQVEPL